MVRFHKRNFITVLLIACVVFSFVSPVFAVETTTAPAAAPAYTRGYLGETSFGESVRSVMTDYSVAFDEVTDGMKSGFDEAYQNFIALFKSGGTDKNGVAQAAAPTITDSTGYVWIPCTNGKFQPSVGYTTSTEVATVVNGDALWSFSGQKANAMGCQVSWSSGALPSAPGTYWLYIDFQSSGVENNRVFRTYGDSNASGSYKPLVQGMQIELTAPNGRTVRCEWNLAPNSTAPDWSNYWCKASAWIVKTAGPDTGSGSFSGFGGGTTRGGGAGRKLDLIPAAKAGEVAAGGALTGSDVLQDYSLFDETSKVISIPQSDGTSTTYTANTWVYNYETRTYNITTTNNTVVNITYGNDKATVTDGSNPPVDYYYASSGSSGGGGNDDSGGGFWDKILGGLADGILGFFKAVGVVLASIATGLVDLLTKAVESVGSLVALVGSLGAVVGGFFAFLPVEVQAAVSAGLIVVITFSVISVLRK